MCKSEVLMKAFDTIPSLLALIDIDETAKNNAELESSAIGALALSDCDYLPNLYGIGKKTVIKHLKDQNQSLKSLGDTAASLTNTYVKSTKLISSWYGAKSAKNLFELQILVWGKQTGKELSSTLKLESLHPGLPLSTQFPTYSLLSGTVLCSQDLPKWILPR